MKALSEEARKVLEQLQAPKKMPDADKGRVLALLQQRAIRGDVSRFHVQALPAPHVPLSLVQRVWASPLAKLGLAVTVLGAPAVAVYTQRHEPPPVARTIAVTPQAQLETPSASAPVLDESDVTPPSEVLAPSPSKPERAASSQATVDAEVHLLKAAQGALRAGDAARALQILDQDAARFPNGRLASERSVTHMVALCKLGQTSQARAEVARFLAKNPQSPLIDHVRTICAPAVENR
jgi:hypothetical protein